MCNQITLKASVDEVASHFKARRPKPTNASTGDVWKGGTGFIVRENAGERMMDAMTWGFPKYLKNKRTGEFNKPLKVNNARDDNLMNEFGMWHEWFVQPGRSEEHTSELQSLMRISYAVFCLKKKKKTKSTKHKR